MESAPRHRQMFVFDDHWLRAGRISQCESVPDRRRGASIVTMMSLLPMP